jgi:hypothetical protein
MDPKKVNLNIAGVDMKGLGDGAMVMAEFDDDWVEVHSGTQGEYAFILKPGRVGTLTIRLSNWSPSNLALSVLAQTNNVAVPFIGTDKSTNSDVFTTPAMMLKTMPAWTKEDVATINEWVYTFGEMVIVHSGAKEVDFS